MRQHRPARPTRGQHELLLYVAPACTACDDARAMLRRVAAEFDDVATRLIDLSVSSEQKPDAVFAVPTFMLDGRVVSLGTPSWASIVETLKRADAGGAPP